MDPHFRQKLLNPLSLRIAQIVFDVGRTRPIITKSQRKQIAPLFIIGSGRSGTTLLRSVLQSHSDIDIPPETMGRIPNSVKKYYRYGGLDWDDLVHVILGEFSSFKTFDLWEIDLEKVKEEALRLPADGRSLARVLDLLYRTHIDTHKPNARIWGDKSPFNTLRLKWIHRVFPKARYIHIIRDGRDVVSSYLKAGLQESIEATCERWNRSLEEVERFTPVFEDRLNTIRYEQFVTKPERTVTQLCDFLDIEYQDSMLKERTVEELQDTGLRHMQNVKNPITKDSIGKWEKNLTDEQKKIVAEKMGKNLKKYGYLKN